MQMNKIKGSSLLEQAMIASCQIDIMSSQPRAITRYGIEPKPHTEDAIMFGAKVHISNCVMPDIDVPEYFLFDMEADTEGERLLNCIQIMANGVIYVIYGPNCVNVAKKTLYKFYKHCVPAIVWDKNMESKLYPHVHDLQVNPLISQGGNRQALDKVAHQMQLIECPKIKSYTVYSETVLPREYVEYAAWDVYIMDMIIFNMKPTLPTRHDF